MDTQSVLPGTLSDVGFAMATVMTWEEYERAFNTMRSLNKVAMWVLGDLLNYGEENFDQRYSQLVDATDYDVDTLARAKRIDMGASPRSGRSA